MSKVGKFFALPPPERRLLVGAAVLLSTVTLGLRLVPFPRLRRMLERLGPPNTRSSRGAALSAERVAWAVVVAGRHVPGTRSCLPQALTVEALLRRQGEPATLRIGVTRTESREFHAHAWVESEGRVVFGGAVVGDYTPLPAL